MKAAISDRLISILAYYTFGIFSLIWIVFANLTKKPMSLFLSFNLYQAIFISVVLAVISLLYGIAIDLISVVPFVGKLAVGFNLFFNETPIYFGFTLSGLVITLLVIYLSIMSLLGIKPYIPMVSEVIRANFGE